MCVHFSIVMQIIVYFSIQITRTNISKLFEQMRTAQLVLELYTLYVTICIHTDISNSDFGPIL